MADFPEGTFDDTYSNMVNEVGGTTEESGNWWDSVVETGGSVWDWINDSENPENLAITGAGLAGLSSLFGLNSSSSRPTGYQGGIPNYTYNRQQIQQPVDPDRRPGSGGRRYFTDGTFTANGTLGPTPSSGIATQQSQLAEGEPAPTGTTTQSTTDPDTQVFAEGGLASMSSKGGGFLDGKTNGMADEIDASIDGKEPAKLSDGEYVFPADVVAYLGGGNTTAGAAELDEMVAGIRKAAIGSEKQINQIDPKKHLRV